MGELNKEEYERMVKSGYITHNENIEAEIEKVMKKRNEVEQNDT